MRSGGVQPVFKNEGGCVRGVVVVGVVQPVCVCVCATRVQE